MYGVPGGRYFLRSFWGLVHVLSGYYGITEPPVLWALMAFLCMGSVRANTADALTTGSPSTYFDTDRLLGYSRLVIRRTYKYDIVRGLEDVQDSSGGATAARFECAEAANAEGW